ncbi:hypothetical protein RUND412_005629 [Rhizina undulata]
MSSFQSASTTTSEPHILSIAHLSALRAYQQTPTGFSLTSCAPSSSPSPSVSSETNRHCTWCGHGGHLKHDCHDLTAAFKAEVVHTRKGKICLGPTGKGGDPIPYPHGEKTLRAWVLKNAKMPIEEYKIRIGKAVGGMVPMNA